MPQQLPHPALSSYCQAFPQTDPLSGVLFPTPGSQENPYSTELLNSSSNFSPKHCINELLPDLPYLFRYLQTGSICLHFHLS